MAKKRNMTLAYAKLRLQHWGYWYDRELTGSLDSKRKRLMNALMLDCKREDRERFKRYFSNWEAEKIDALLNHYYQIEPIKATLTKRHFAFFERPLVEKIERSQCKRSTYFHYLSQSIRWISGCIESK